MPVTQRDPPTEVREAVQAALQHFARIPEAQLHALAGTRPSELALTVPHPVFSLGLSDLTATGALTATRPTGWRYLLRQGDEVVASAATSATRAGDEQFSHFNQGPFVASTTVALATANGLPETQDRSFELRLLNVPALFTMALWLHADGDNDVLIPLNPSPDGIESNRPYSADVLLRLLAEKARQIPPLESNDKRGG